MRAQRRLVDPVDAQREVVEVAALAAGGRTAHAPEFAFDVDEIDQRASGAELDQPELLLPLLDRAAEHVAIEADHPVHVAHAQHEMVDAEDRHCGGVDGRHESPMR